jgi:hypothetical protein
MKAFHTKRNTPASQEKEPIRATNSPVTLMTSGTTALDRTSGRTKVPWVRLVKYFHLVRSDQSSET